jgi:Holliday junction resolvasome RuvABC endonuclease subunit
MIHIGIDQSYSCTAYCILKGDNVLDFGTIKTKKDDGDIYFRANYIIQNLKEVIKQYNNLKVSIEGLAFGNTIGNSSRDLAGLIHIIINHFRYDLDMTDISIIAPTSVKKYATNNGKASKKEMVESLPENVRKLFKDKKYKVSTGLYDLTDAYYIAKINQQPSQTIDLETLKSC